MKIIGIIPSRYGSTRLPGKPLEMIGDTSLVMRVFNQCKMSESLEDVIVATDDQRIQEHVMACGGKSMMTAEHHSSGTERLAEVLENLDSKPDALINIQGDEPFIHPQQIDQLCSLIKDGAKIATLCKEIQYDETLVDPNQPKVVLSEDGRALYFSRSVIPYQSSSDPKNEQFKHYKHIGIYGYRSEILATISKLPASMIEEMERLEQLRWLANGFEIQVGITEHESRSVDTPADLDLARSYLDNLDG